MGQSVYLGNIDITGMVTKIEISGSWSEVARSCDITYVNAPYDPVVQKLPIPTIGNAISVIDSDDGLLFSGTVSGAERNSSYGEITANCVDKSNALSRNKCKYSFANNTPEAIAATICRDFEISVGALAKTGISIKSYVVDGKDIYTAIMDAYKKAAAQNKKSYQMRATGEQISVVEAKDEVSGVVLSDMTNITASSYQEKSDSLVNKVIIYDSSGAKRGELSDEVSISKYGLHQSTYTMEDGKDNTAAAKAMLNKPEQSLSVTAIGSNAVISGKTIVLHDGATGLNGIYWIKTDKHTYQNGIHTMDLELSFEALKEDTSEEGDG